MLEDWHMKITNNRITVVLARLDLYEVIEWTKKNLPL
jgi:hypothetical protein